MLAPGGGHRSLWIMHEGVNPALALNERGIAVSVWTANNRVVMRRLIANGVDAIMTNYPDRLLGLLTSRPGPNA